VKSTLLSEFPHLYGDDRGADSRVVEAKDKNIKRNEQPMEPDNTRETVRLSRSVTGGNSLFSLSNAQGLDVRGRMTSGDARDRRWRSVFDRSFTRSMSFC
jgi:hypothetical protein